MTGFFSMAALHRRRLPVTFPARRPGAVPEQHHRLDSRVLVIPPFILLFIIWYYCSVIFSMYFLIDLICSS
uniref:Uncharacterized protein n=1 Tax=Zea mays TaxID=4577 RepID=B6T0A1_MAIZE|nr:hypothetical protein [Zea mays]